MGLTPSFRYTKIQIIQIKNKHKKLYISMLRHIIILKEEYKLAIELKNIF